MNKNTTYIYIRNHPSYDIHDVCKMGRTNNITSRDSLYATGEINRGYFEIIFEIYEKIEIIDKLLKNEFHELNVKYDAGTEFYHKKIINLIEPYLITLGIKYKKLNTEEIDNIKRNRIRKLFKKINIQSLIKVLKSDHVRSSITNKKNVKENYYNLPDNIICKFCNTKFSSDSNLIKHQNKAKYCIKIQNDLKNDNNYLQKEIDNLKKITLEQDKKILQLETELRIYKNMVNDEWSKRY